MASDRNPSLGKEEALLTLEPKSARIKVASEMPYSRVHIGCQEMVISGSFDYICQNSGKPQLNCSQTGWEWENMTCHITGTF